MTTDELKEQMTIAMNKAHAENVADDEKLRSFYAALKKVAQACEGEAKKRGIRL